MFEKEKWDMERELNARKVEAGIELGKARLESESEWTRQHEISREKDRELEVKN